MQILSHTHDRTRILPRFVIAMAIYLSFWSHVVDSELVIAEEKADSPPTFSSILDRGTRQTTKDVSRYIVDHPDALDVPSAYKWLFQTALEQGLETEALPMAQRLLKGNDSPNSLLSVARQVRCLGLAKSGKIEESLSVFDQHMQTVRFRTAGNTVEFGFTFATQIRIAGELDAARTVYDNISRKFFLNNEIRQSCENKIAKLGLMNKAAPKTQVVDLKANRVDLADYKGRVVIVDFWATNCPPCLKEFPQLKQLYAEFHDKGLEIVGISLDDDQEVVETFQQTWKLPWHLVVKHPELDGLRRQYHVVKIPSLFLVDKNGNIVQLDIKGKDLRRAVEKSLTTSRD